MDGARIFATWGQRGGRAKGIGAKHGMSLEHLAIIWGHVRAANGQGRGHRGTAAPLLPLLVPLMGNTVIPYDK